MKIRSSFVSNSSSSSFILCLDKGSFPKNIEDLKKFLFGEWGDTREFKHTIIDNYYDDDNCIINIDNILKLILVKVTKSLKKPNNIEELVQQLSQDLYYPTKIESDKCYCNSRENHSLSSCLYSCQNILGILGFEVDREELTKIINLHTQYEKLLNQYFDELHKIQKESREKIIGVKNASNYQYRTTKKQDEEIDLLCKQMKDSNKKYQTLWKKERAKLEEFEDRLNKYTTRIVKKFIQENPSKELIICEFSDNDGREESICEHCDVFRNIKNMRISHH